MNDISPLLNRDSVQLTNAPRLARYSLWVLMVGIVALVVWAYLGRIDQVTRAPAQLIAQGRTQLVQSSDGGVLTLLHVKE